MASFDETVYKLKEFNVWSVSFGGNMFELSNMHRNFMFYFKTEYLSIKIEHYLAFFLSYIQQ